ncbi:MAG: hypothetical protein R2799_07645 [Crocinitomicaceae bacterium]
MAMLNQKNAIPTHEQFLAYVNGKMAGEEKASFESAINSDAFLAEALEGYQAQSDWIGSISARVSDQIQSKYPSGKSGNGKYIYFSVAAIAIVILSIVWINLPVETNEVTADHDQIIQPEGGKESNGLITPDSKTENKFNDASENNNKYSGNENAGMTEDELKLGKDMKSNNLLIEEEGLKPDFEEDYKEDIILNMDKKKNDPKIEEKIAVSGQARLAVIDVAIGVKEHPLLDSKQKTKIINGQVVTIDKTKNNPNYSQEDVPSYFGGDGALLAEIKGSIKPVVVELSAQYDRVIGFDFEVAADGKVDSKTLNFRGNPYPQIKTQIEKMIQNFPMFIPGKASGKKGRIRYGIMLKY